MDAQDAKRRVDRIKLVGRWILGILTVVVAILGVLKIGTDSHWIFLRDFQGSLANVHWALWSEIGGVILAAFGAATAISFSFRYVAIKSVLNQIIQNNSTHIGSLDNSVHHTTNNHGVEGDVWGEVQRVGEHVRQLEQLLADKQANPEHVRQLQEFLEYAQNERILELKEQLARDAELFERLRVLMSQLAAECENAGSQAQGVLTRRR